MDSDEYNDDGQCTIEPINRKGKHDKAPERRNETKDYNLQAPDSMQTVGQQSTGQVDSSMSAMLASAGQTVPVNSRDDNAENALNREPADREAATRTPEQLNAPEHPNAPGFLNTSEHQNMSKHQNAPDHLNASEHPNAPQNPNASQHLNAPVNTAAAENTEQTATDADQLNSQVEDDDSTTSSSHPPVATIFKPNYVIAVLPSELEFDEYSVYYVIKAIHIGKTSDSKSDLRAATGRKDAPEEMIVKREFDDFLYLNHVLVNSAYPGYGLIVPPLPNKPKLDDIYLTTQEVLFNRNAFLTNLLYDEQYQKECWFLEQYLHAMLNHPTFGKDPFWHRFLMINEQPPKIKLKKNSNLLSSLFASSDSQESMFATSKPNRMMHRDCDDYFQRERDWLNYYQYLMKEALDAFNAKTQARTRLCNTLEHLSTTLTLNFATDEGVLSRILSKLNNTFSKSLIECSNAMQIMSLNDETTVSCNFEFFEKYLRNAKDMMNNRVCLLIDYENANRNLEKAKTGSKRQAAEKLKYESEKIFEDCSEIARIEMKRLHKEMNQKLTESIENYAKWQLISNQEILRVMKNSILLLKQVQL